MNIEEMVETMDADEKAVFYLSEQWAKAMVENDADMIGKFMADDWRMVSKFGPSDKLGFLAMVASGDLSHSSFDLRELAGIRIYGDTAILSGRVTNTADFRGMQFEADEWTTDVFRKEDGEWKCVHTHITDAEERPKRSN